MPEILCVWIPGRFRQKELESCIGVASFAVCSFSDHYREGPGTSPTADGNPFLNYGSQRYRHVKTWHMPGTFISHVSGGTHVLRSSSDSGYMHTRNIKCFLKETQHLEQMVCNVFSNVL
jgi:hypothetical protein